MVVKFKLFLISSFKPWWLPVKIKAMQWSR